MVGLIFRHVFDPGNFLCIESYDDYGIFVKLCNNFEQPPINEHHVTYRWCEIRNITH